MQNSRFRTVTYGRLFMFVHGSTRSVAQYTGFDPQQIAFSGSPEPHNLYHSPHGATQSPEPLPLPKFYVDQSNPFAVAAKGDVRKFNI